MKFAMYRRDSACAALTFSSWFVAMAGCGDGDDTNRSSGAPSTVHAAGSSEAGATVEKPQRLDAVPRRYSKKGITAVVLSPNGASIATTRADGTVRVLNAGSATDVVKFSAKLATVAAGVAFNSDGKYLGIVGRDCDVHIFNVSSGRKLYTLHGREHPIGAIAQSPNGTLIATAGEETRVMLWRGATGKLDRILAGLRAS